ncbi:DNA pilot protein VP2 [Microviridae Fen2266_11]|uniref:DNA pilot protein VP2 n=1 Tax=Microviridae Fen2266_11 TaxID=1655652 RepID=UPI00063D604E|nr:DNA pilot protein VP2 [Microviridae Fen2266_11]AKI26902.1 DNA pilot protein VP2 [Microviridae Fen2266_11]
MADSSDPGLSIVAGAIPIVGGVISSLINNSAVDANNAANRAFQVQQQQSQNEYNQAMWQEQTDYNNPQNMMDRYEAAGLNPNLIYGNATGNVAAQAPMEAKVDYVAQPHPSVDGSAMAAQAVQSANNTKLVAAQSNNLQAQTTNTAEDTVLKKFVEALTSAEADKTSAEASFAGPTAQASIGNLLSSSFKNQVDAQTTSMLAPYSANMQAAQTDKLKADTNFTINDNVRQAALASTTIQEAISRIAMNAMTNAKSAAEIQQIRANTQLILGSKALQDMDLSMRNAGMMPHDGFIQRLLGGIGTWITGSNSAGGYDHFDGSPSTSSSVSPKYGDPILGN